MTEVQRNLFLILLTFSVAILVIPGTYVFVRWIVRKIKGRDRSKSGIGRVVSFSICLIGSIFFLRYAVGYYSTLFTTSGSGLSCWEEIFNSFLHTLQTFSMDEEYTEYISNGNKLFAEIFAGYGWMELFFRIYSTTLNIVAPIAGGAVIFEILSSIFPKIKLGISRLAFWKEKCYFSELNANSLALAKSIIHDYKNELNRPKPIIIFADTYFDNEEEKDYELFLEAKRIGAICLRSDLKYVRKHFLGKRSYYLIDEAEFSNLKELINLADDENKRYIKKANIYLFVQSDAYVKVEQTVREKISLAKKDFPTIIPIDSCRNMVNNLLAHVPLYEPLINNPDQNELKVTILGSGNIGTEALLSVYWMGQMLISKIEKGKHSMAECALKINVISKEEEKDFDSKLDYINPEIRRTEKEHDKLLEYKPGLFNNPYCSIEYTKADVKSGEFLDSETAKILLDTDYFIVALGNDADNISVAEKLRCFIGKQHLDDRITKGSSKGHNNTVIAYAVFDSTLCEELNEERAFNSYKNGKSDIYMYAFGSIDKVYSRNNTLMSKYSCWAKGIGKKYLKEQEEKLSKENEKRATNEDKNYTYWADLARAIHIKYKIFSLGWIKTSVFDKSISAQSADVREIYDQYKRIAESADPKQLSDDDKLRFDELEIKKHLLAWLEHRRWNAFTRTMGYRKADIETLEENCKKNRNHKNMPLKLHPCLVEARKPEISEDSEKSGYILAEFDESGKVNEKTVFKAKEEEYRDLLDEVTYRWKPIADKANEALTEGDNKVSFYDFKVYDYHHHDFG